MWRDTGITSSVSVHAKRSKRRISPVKGLIRKTFLYSPQDDTVSVFDSVSAYPEHDDCIYGLSWSFSDEFAFSSVSYDGRFVLNFVPADIKNEILLS